MDPPRKKSFLVVIREYEFYFNKSGQLTAVCDSLPEVGIVIKIELKRSRLRRSRCKQRGMWKHCESFWCFVKGRHHMLEFGRSHYSQVKLFIWIENSRSAAVVASTRLSAGTTRDRTSDGYHNDLSYNGGHDRSWSDGGDPMVEWLMEQGTLIELSIMATDRVWFILFLSGMKYSFNRDYEYSHSWYNKKQKISTIS